jgi:tripartite-type tricarboxylate transporter receptor subunit TctC
MAASRSIRALSAAVLLAAAPALAQQYPARPVRMLVGYPAGGGVDTVARVVGGKLGDALGQQFLVENRPGAGAMLATEAAAKAAPDGYTLYVAETAILIAPSIYAKIPYDPARSFAPVGGICSLPLVFVANPSVAAATAPELIALLKANPGKYSYGSPGIGTVHHLAFELFKRQAGVDVVHVPYRGAAQIVPDLISNQIPLAIVSAPPALAQARAGKLRPIALSSPAKLASAPDWPALAATLPGFDASPRIFLLAPSGTPAEVVGRLNGALKAALAQPDVLEGFNAQGATPAWSTPDALGAEMAAEVRKWGAIAKESGARQE